MMSQSKTYLPRQSLCATHVDSVLDRFIRTALGPFVLLLILTTKSEVIDRLSAIGQGLDATVWSDNAAQG